MTAPETGPAVAATVAARLKLTDPADLAELDDVVAATNALIRTWPCGVLSGDEVEAWPAHTVQGANMLAARLYRRRNSPMGVEAIGDGPAYVRRNDPDIAALLKLGDHLTPRVG